MKKLKNLYCRFEDSIAVVFMALLVLIPLIVKILRSAFHLPIVNSDNAQVNLVFMFACLASMITWRENSHISLDSLTTLFPEKMQSIVKSIRTGASSCLLVAIFLASFSEFFVSFPKEQKLWGIPQMAIFAFLPFAYLSMLVRKCSQKENRLSAFIGLVIGLFIGMIPFTGVLYYLFGLDSLDFLYSINNLWILIAEKAFIPLIILLILFALTGVPLFIILSGIAYIAFSKAGGYVEVLSMEAYTVLIDKNIAAIPMFTIAGYILAKGSAGKRLVDIFKSMFGWIRGGTSIAAVVVITFFTVFTGASGVTILALGSLLSIALCGSGYKRENAESLITASGALGLLFPPSVAIIMYGTVNYFSVDVYDLFRGAIIPGLILAISMMAMGIIKDTNVNRPKFSGQEILKSIKNGFWELLLPILVVVSYFSGLFNLMETAAFTALYAFILEVFIRRDFKFKESLGILASGIPITGGVLMIIASARGLSYYMIDASIPAILSDFIITHVQSKYLFLLLMNICLIFVGCLMDIYSAIMIVSPLLVPIAESFGISQIHLGVIFLMNLQLGFLTPPVGMDLFIASYTFDTPLLKIVKNILPYLLIQFIVLLLITYIPWFTQILF